MSAHFLPAIAIYIQRHRFHSCIVSDSEIKVSSLLLGKIYKVVVESNSGGKADLCRGIGESRFCSSRFLFSFWNITSSPLIPGTHIPFIILIVTMQKICFSLGSFYKDTMSLQVGAILQVKLLTLTEKEKRWRGWGWGPESIGHCGGWWQEEHCDMIQKSFIKCEDRIQARLCRGQAGASQVFRFRFMFLDSGFSSVKRVLFEMTSQVPWLCDCCQDYFPYVWETMGALCWKMI